MRRAAQPVNQLVAYLQNAREVLRHGGLDTGEQPTPYEVVQRRPMYRLRRYFPAPGERPSGARTTTWCAG